MSKINTRSPYFINITTPNITSAVLELYIYTGTQVATMDSITYSLESDAYNGYVSFEVSQLISDYLDITYGGVSTSQVAWVNYQVTETINNVATTPSSVVQTVAFDGYGYFEDEVNPQLSDKLLQSNDKIVILDNNSFYIPVQQDNLDYIDLMYQGEEVGKVVAEASQNLILHSEDVSTTWTATQLDLDLNAIVTGSYFGDRIVATNTTSPHWITQTVSKDTVQKDYTGSVYVKAAEYSRIYLRLSGSGGAALIAYFDTVSKQFTNVATTGDFSNIEIGYSDEGDGWFRVYMSTNSSNDNYIDFAIGIVDDNGDYSFTGDNLNGVNLSGIYIRGMQLQEGALGAYVETTSSSVTTGGGTTYPLREYFTSTTSSTDVIRYIGYTVTNYIFQDENNYLFQDLNNFIFSDEAAYADAIRITYDDASTKTIKIERRSECKHEPYRITFINKFGALQSVWMFKRSDVSMSVENENYRGFTGSSTGYDISEHQYRNYNVIGKESISLNSGFYTEDMNEVFRQVLLSEKIWIYYNEKILPVNIKSKELAFKTQVNDKLIDYKIDFEFAFDKINSVF